MQLQIFISVQLFRKAGDSSFTLGPHVDGGSTERWEDDEYRKVYRHLVRWRFGDVSACNGEIFQGRWEDYDAFDATYRASASYDLSRSSASGAPSARGDAMVDHDDVLPSSFCGANPGKVQDLFPEFHQQLIDCLVPIPDVHPGDTVWWHCDLIHAVEGVHGGSEDAADTCLIWPSFV
eukprot:Skav203996  [mRNA]  locus=scaffold2961:85773:89356:+ [translate_table: standard]